MLANFRNIAQNSMEGLGQLMLLLVARLARPAYLPYDRPRPVRRFLARRAIDGIVAVGRAVDRVNIAPATTHSIRYRRDSDIIRLSAVAGGKPDTTF